MTPREIADGLTLSERAALAHCIRAGDAFLYGGEDCDALKAKALLAVVKDRYPSWSVVRVTGLGRAVAGAVEGDA